MLWSFALKAAEQCHNRCNVDSKGVFPEENLLISRWCTILLMKTSGDVLCMFWTTGSRVAQ
eukprot:3264241-Ditylum_brightwellii.AAC.1